MHHHSHQSLSVEEAKASLRVAAHRVSPAVWIQRHPWRLLTLALVSGFLSARLHIPILHSIKLSRQYAPLLIGQLLRRKTRQAHRRTSANRK